MKNITLDIKTILILLFLTLTLIFGYKWYFSGSNTESKKRVKELEKEVIKLEEQKKVVDISIKKWEDRFDNLDKKDKSIREDQLKIERELIKYIYSNNKDKEELELLKKRMVETLKKIEQFKKSPPDRTGLDLINSIKNNTK